jgi:hypothetical protein
VTKWESNLIIPSPLGYGDLVNLNLSKKNFTYTSFNNRNQKESYIFRGFYRPTPVQSAVLSHMDYVRKVIGKEKGFV